MQGGNPKGENYHMLEIILRGGVNQYYQDNYSFSKTTDIRYFNLINLRMYAVMQKKTRVYRTCFYFT